MSAPARPFRVGDVVTLAPGAVGVEGPRVVLEVDTITDAQVAVIRTEVQMDDRTMKAYRLARDFVLVTPADEPTVSTEGSWTLRFTQVETSPLPADRPAARQALRSLTQQALMDRINARLAGRS